MSEIYGLHHKYPLILVYNDEHRLNIQNSNKYSVKRKRTTDHKYRSANSRSGQLRNPIFGMRLYTHIKAAEEVIFGHFPDRQGSHMT